MKLETSQWGHVTLITADHVTIRLDRSDYDIEPGNQYTMVSVLFDFEENFKNFYGFCSPPTNFDTIERAKID